MNRATAALDRRPGILTIEGHGFWKPVSPRGIDVGVPLAPAYRGAFAHPTDASDPVVDA